MAEQIEQYTQHDLIVPILAEQGLLRGSETQPSCVIKIIVRPDDIRLWVGPRDWQWDRRTGALIGAGTFLLDDLG